MPNPFFFGGRIEPNLFIGRKTELRAIFNCLETVHSGQMQSISVVGPHRMGRSSLLYYVTQVYQPYLREPQRYRLAYLSLHDADCHTPAGLLARILAELNLASPVSENLTLSEFQAALTQLRQMNIQPVICLDEFEELIQSGAFTNEFFDSWRHLMSNNLVAFVIASTHPLNELIATNQYTSSFFNIFTIVELGEFSGEDIEQLISRGRNCDLPFNYAEAGLMRQLGGSHPYKLQVAGSKIYLAKTAGGGMDWAEVKKAFNNQLVQAGLTFKPRRSWKRIVGMILSFIRSIGRAVLEPRKAKSEISESTALWWGIVAIVILLALGLGLLPLGYLLKFGAHWLAGGD